MISSVGSCPFIIMDILLVEWVVEMPQNNTRGLSFICLVAGAFVYVLGFAWNDSARILSVLIVLFIVLLYRGSLFQSRLLHKLITCSLALLVLDMVGANIALLRGGTEAIVQLVTISRFLFCIFLLCIGTYIVSKAAQNSFRVPLLVPSLVIVTLLVCMLPWHLRPCELVFRERLSFICERFQPVVASIKAFERDKKRAPHNIEELGQEYTRFDPKIMNEEGVHFKYDEGFRNRTWELSLFIERPAGTLYFRPDHDYRSLNRICDDLFGMLTDRFNLGEWAYEPPFPDCNCQ